MADSQLDRAGLGEGEVTEKQLIYADKLAEMAQTDDRLEYLLKVCDANPTAEELVEYQEYYDAAEAILEPDEAARTKMQLLSEKVVNFFGGCPFSVNSRFGGTGTAVTTGQNLDNYRKRNADFDSPPYRRVRTRIEKNDPFAKYEPAAPPNPGTEARENSVERRSISPLFVMDSREPTLEASEPPVFDPGDPFAVMRWKKKQKEKAAASKKTAPAADLGRINFFAQATKRKQESSSQRAAHGTRTDATSNQTSPSQKAGVYERRPPDAPLLMKFEPSRDVLETYRSGSLIPLAHAEAITSTPSQPFLRSSGKPSAFANMSRTSVHPFKWTSSRSIPSIPGTPKNEPGEAKTKAVHATLGKRQTGERSNSKQSKDLKAPSNSRAVAMLPVQSHIKKHSQSLTPYKPYKPQIEEFDDVIAEKERIMESTQSDINQVRRNHRRLQKAARREFRQLDLEEARVKRQKPKFPVNMARASHATDDDESEAEAWEEGAKSDTETSYVTAQVAQ